MKQYIMGMLTGASLILCAVMFIGASSGGNGKYQAWEGARGQYLLDTSTGQAYEREGERGNVKWREMTAKPKFLFKGRDSY